MDFSMFMKDKRKERKTVKYVASADFIGPDGAPMEWELKAIPCRIEREIRNKYTKTGRNGDTVFDGSGYTLALAAATVVFPPLKSAELQNSYGVMGESALLQEMLDPGQLSRLTIKAQEVNGYTETFGELIEQAKN